MMTRDIADPLASTYCCLYLVQCSRRLPQHDIGVNSTKKRSRQHLSETDKYVSSNNDNVVMDLMALSIAYKKIKALCTNIQNEISTYIHIYKQDILPSFINLPNLTTLPTRDHVCRRKIITHLQGEIEGTVDRHRRYIYV